MHAISRRGCFVAASLFTVLLAAGPARGQVYVGNMTGSQETPPVITPGFGTATVTLSGNLMTVNAVFASLLGLTTAAHIHCCALPGFPGPPATVVPSFPDFPTGVTAGTYSRIFDLTLASSYNPAFVTAHGSPLAARDVLIANLNAGTTYFNVHTNMFPGGEIRGQLMLQTEVVPEPASMALLLTGLAGLGALRRRRRDAVETDA